MTLYSIKEMAKLSGINFKDLQLAVDSLIEKGLVKKVGDKLDITDMGVDFMKFISPPEEAKNET